MSLKKYERKYVKVFEIADTTIVVQLVQVSPGSSDMRLQLCAYSPVYSDQDYSAIATCDITPSDETMKKISQGYIEKFGEEPCEAGLIVGAFDAFDEEDVKQFYIMMTEEKQDSFVRYKKSKGEDVEDDPARKWLS